MAKLWTSLLVLLLGTPLRAAAEPPRREPMDEAIDKALEFLHRTQDPEGAWRMGNEPNAAITGLCVMAFLSAGHVPGEGRYGPTVEKGVRWVLGVQQPQGLIAKGGGQEMYHHGICTLMLAEVAGMTDDQLAGEIRDKLKKAVSLILKSQRAHGNPRGGWRYQAGASDSDISVTGWQVMALRAAKNCGCDVPADSIERAVDYIKRCQDPRTGGFRYMPEQQGANMPRTGTGLLCLEICGKQWHRSPEALKAGNYLLQAQKALGGQHFSYGVYYCSQGMFQLGGNYWKAFRQRLHEVLLPRQQSNGSFADRDGFGPQYPTAMAVLALTVEYRYLPIYQRDEDADEKPR